MNQSQIKEKFGQAFPNVPAGYHHKVETILKTIEAQPVKRPSAMHRPRFLPGKIIAAALAILIVGSGCALAVRPALAANIPLVNEMVYTLSPMLVPDIAMQNKIAETVRLALSDFVSNAAHKVGIQFKSGDNWVLNEDTLLVVYYLNYKAVAAELTSDGKTPAVANIVIEKVEAEQKGFRYKAQITFDILLDGEYFMTEKVNASLEENINGLYITALDINGEGFDAYKALVAQYDRAEYNNGTLDENIVHYNAFLIGREHALDEKEKHQTTDPAMPTQQKLEAIASELCYRYWSATEAMPDMNDLMERNEDTDLWFLDVQLRQEKINRGMLTPSVIVEKGYSTLLEIISEADGLIAAKMHVKTIIDGGVGQTILLTFKPTGDSYIIVAYDSPWDDGQYRTLKEFADQYRKDGMSSAEANTKAYEALYEEIK